MTRVKIKGMDFHPKTLDREAFWRLMFELLAPYEYGTHPHQWINIAGSDELDVYRKFCEWCNDVGYEVVINE